MKPLLKPGVLAGCLGLLVIPGKVFAGGVDVAFHGAEFQNDEIGAHLYPGGGATREPVRGRR